MENLVPLQNMRELDSMVKNSTRDLKTLKDFVMKEKNPVVKTQLEQILISSWNLARKFDGCQKMVMESPEFRKECREVFLLISAQKRGGRKLFLNTTSSPVNGLDQVHFTWWSTVRVYQGATLRFMDDFIAKLSAPPTEPMSDSAISAGISSNESLDMSNPNWCKNLLLKDVTKIISDKADEVGALNGFGIGSSFNEGNESNIFTLTITLISRDRDDDSDVGDTRPGNQKELKREIPFRSIIPKSESSRQDVVGIMRDTPLVKPKSSKLMETDEDGFWTKYDRDLPLSAAKTEKKKEPSVLDDFVDHGILPIPAERNANGKLSGFY